MARAQYTLQTGGAVALSAATAKTVLCVMSPSSFGIDLLKWKVGFDGTTSTAVPVLCELMTSTLASNSTPGTGNTTGTVTQVSGRSITAGFTGFYGSTSEPTVLTAFESWILTPTGGLVFYDYPLGDSPDVGVSAGIVLRCTAPAAVNVRASFQFARA